MTVDGAGTPYIRQGNGYVFRWTDDAWVRIPGNVVDLAAGPDGSLFAISSNPSSKQIYKMNFELEEWTPFGDF